MGFRHIMDSANRRAYKDTFGLIMTFVSMLTLTATFVLFIMWRVLISYGIM